MVTTCLHIRSTPIIKTIIKVKVTEVKVMGLLIRSHSKGLWVIRSMSAKLGHRDILIRSHIYIYIYMLGQGHKIILTMSRWPNCPNMCGANEVPSMRCQ